MQKIELTLLHRVAEGDHNAFRQLFEQCSDPMYAAIYNYTRSALIAEELTQEAFIKLWKHRARLKEVEEPTAYLYRIVFNLINTYLKKAANEARILEQIRSVRKTEDNNTIQQIEANEIEFLITRAIDKLPPQKKTIYRLSRVEGLSYQEIATRLNLSPHTVKNHLIEALKQLRGYLKEHALEISLLLLPVL